MKKLLILGVLLLSIIGVSSCSYDDSNDIDIIIPKDSTQGKMLENDKLKT